MSLTLDIKTLDISNDMKNRLESLRHIDFKYDATIHVQSDYSYHFTIPGWIQEFHMDVLQDIERIMDCKVTTFGYRFGMDDKFFIWTERERPNETK